MEAATVGAGRRPGPRSFWTSLDRGQRRTLLLMGLVVAGLHVLGFLTLIALVAPHRYRLGTAGAFTVGIGVTAYTLGLRHAFDADHISAIDNTTRKLMAEEKRPLSVGFWFSLWALNDRVRARIAVWARVRHRDRGRAARTGGGAAGAELPWYAILCLPVLFAAGMSLIDAIDGSFMNFAYGWAFSNPVRKVFYNITITGLSVAVALVIGTVELGGLIASQPNLSGSFWSGFENINLNLLGFAIVGMFIAAWAIAPTVWRFGRIEKRWSLHLSTSAKSE